MAAAKRPEHQRGGGSPNNPLQSDPEKLGRTADAPVPVDMAVRGAGVVLAARFNYELWFKGELVQLTTTPGGHGYGILRGVGARIPVYLAPHIMRRGHTPEDGSLVLVRGRLTVWERGGQFQIRASEPLIPTDLTGARAAARREAERQLKAEGLLDRRRRSIPRFPSLVAVVTSASGAALRDVRATVGRRAPWIRVSLHDCVVQGAGAPNSIVAALDAADVSAADIVLLTRGGGAADAMDPFDDPAVVRRVGTMRRPIIVAVGHEGDQTLADRAADLSMSTPTAAAEKAVPDGEGLRRELLECRRRLHEAARTACSIERSRARQARDAVFRETFQQLQIRREWLRRVEPGALAASLMQRHRVDRVRLEHTYAAVLRDARSMVRRQRSRASALRQAVLAKGDAALQTARRLAGELRRAIRLLSPDRVLARGYALVQGRDGRPVWFSSDVRSGETLRIRLHDGELAVVVAGPNPSEPPRENSNDHNCRRVFGAGN